MESQGLKQFTYHTLLSYSSTIVVDHVHVFSTTVTFDSRSSYHLCCTVTPQKCVSSAVLTESEFMFLWMSCQFISAASLSSPSKISYTTLTSQCVSSPRSAVQSAGEIIYIHRSSTWIASTEEAVTNLCGFSSAFIARSLWEGPCAALYCELLLSPETWLWAVVIYSVRETGWTAVCRLSVALLPKAVCQLSIWGVKFSGGNSNTSRFQFSMALEL